MVKLAGLFFAFLACTILGFYKSLETKQRRTLLMEFKELLQQISTEIGYFKEPLPQIFQRIFEENQNKETTAFMKESLSLYHHENRELTQIWETALLSVYENQPLKKEDLAVMKKCGAFLGQSDYARQQEHFKLLNRQLDRQLSAADEEIRTKGRMYARMGISIGFIIVILFI